MLALARSTRAPHRLALHARALTSATHDAGLANVAAAGASNSPAPDNTEAAMRQRRKRHSAECLFVYPWNGIRSSAEGLAIARALQNKYGPAKEVIFPRDSSCINLFQPYFWLVFDHPNVRKLLPEASAQINVQVVDLPRSDGNVGLEDMMRGLGLPASEPPPAPAENEASEDEDASDAPPGYKSLDVRVEWARYGPGEVLNRRRTISKSHPSEDVLPHFATAWLAFDGFSPESARGPHTPNLLRAREKWRKIAPEPSSSADDVDDFPHTVTSASSMTVLPFQEPIDARTEQTSELAAFESQTQQTKDVPSSREWVPIVPGGSQRHKPNSTPARKAASAHAPASTSPPLDSARSSDTTHAADPANDDTTDGRASTPPPEGRARTATTKISRRERILQLARQNARTPLPEPVEEPKPPAEAAEKESERQMKERTIRERLWRLVGGNY